MKKILFIVAIMFFYTGITNVNASKAYYTNSNNVSFTKEEYDFISDILYDGYQESMTFKDYDALLKNGISSDIQKETYTAIAPFGTIHTTTNKSLTITKAKNSDSTIIISLVATWLNDPVIRSYDLIGAYLKGFTINTAPVTRVKSTSGMTEFNNIKNDNYGFGVSVKLPTSASDIVISQYFRVSGSGNIYASYQHAKSNISLSDSQKYTISTLGSGNVFLFEGSVHNYFDHMGGVNIFV